MFGTEARDQTGRKDQQTLQHRGGGSAERDASLTRGSCWCWTDEHTCSEID